MATVGKGILSPAVAEFFDAVRSYDAKRAALTLAPDVDFDSPWSGRMAGRDVVEAFLKGWLSDPVKRPSFSIMDIQGDGAVVRLKVSVSGRFGKAPEHFVIQALSLSGLIHNATFVPVAATKH